jgi:hypothetical protein
MHTHGREVVAKAGLKVTESGCVEWMAGFIEDFPAVTRCGKTSKKRR